MIIKKKTSKQSRIYNDLFDIYEAKGSLAAWNWASTLVKEGEITAYEANALMEEIGLCFETGLSGIRGERKSNERLHR